MSFVVDTEIARFIESSGYDIERIGRPCVHEPILACGGPNDYAVRQATARDCYAVVLRKIPKYRDAVAPKDLGKRCEFSNSPFFSDAKTAILESICLGIDGKPVYQGATGNRASCCRILDEEAAS